MSTEPLFAAIREQASQLPLDRPLSVEEQLILRCAAAQDITELNRQLMAMQRSRDDALAELERERSLEHASNGTIAVDELRRRLQLVHEYLITVWKTNTLPFGMSNELIDSLNRPI